MLRNSTSIAAVAAFLVALTAMPAVHAAPVGEFTDYGDVGSPQHAGRTTYNAASQEYVLSGSGTNMWGTRDEFHYAWRKLSGDFILQARVTFVLTRRAHSANAARHHANGASTPHGSGTFSSL